MAKKKVASRKKKSVRLKSVTVAEQNPAAVDLEALKRTLAKKTGKRSK
ncbi:hypothetical protein L0244_18255 [bacterium]|nr:hypothetical protein [bacterium]